MDGFNDGYSENPDAFAGGVSTETPTQAPMTQAQVQQLSQQAGISVNQVNRAMAGQDISKQFQSMPTFFLIILILFFVLGPILMLRSPPIDSGSGFMMNQMWINMSLIITTTVLYGILVIAFPDSAIEKYRNLLIPTILIIVMWIKGVITYRNAIIPYCKEQYANGNYTEGQQPYRSDMLWWNTSKIPIAIFATYLVIVIFPQTIAPFNEFFCGDEIPHQLVEYFSIGFWIGCAAWASEASCYFSMLRYGCEPTDNIDFASINEKIAEYQEDENSDDDS